MTTPLVVAEITDLGDLWHVTLEAIAYQRANEAVREEGADWLCTYDAALLDHEGCAAWLRDHLDYPDLPQDLRPVRVSGRLTRPRKGVAQVRIVQSEVLHHVS